MSAIQGFEAAYRVNISRYERLVEEVKFILTDIAVNAGIAIQSVSGRVKELDSILEKVQRKNYKDPASQVQDIVGCRIVCLFIADLETIQDEILKQFDVISFDDKVRSADDPATFGYLSKHYICQLNATQSGPRYNGLKGINFEIQCRTILMDAWANVSHYLAYKSDVSIPADLQRDFYALSGLFYIADKQFELFSNRVLPTLQEAISGTSTKDLAGEEINLETIQALLTRLFPDRPAPDRQDSSEFADEVAKHGYETIGELEDALKHANDAALRYESDHPPYDDQARRYTAVGIARQAIGIITHSYDEDNNWQSYEEFVTS